MRKVFTFPDKYEDMKDGANKPVEGVEDDMKEWTSNKSTVIFVINLNLIEKAIQTEVYSFSSSPVHGGISHRVI